MSSSDRNVLLLPKERGDLPASQLVLLGLFHRVPHTVPQQTAVQGFKMHLDMSIYSSEPERILAVSSPVVLKRLGDACLVPRVTQISNQYFKDSI